MHFYKIRYPILFIFILAGIFRFTQLSDRPMHGDEAINAVKLAEVMDAGRFDYNPHQHHGPIFYYTSALFAAVHGLWDIQEFHESFLRGITAFVGLILIWLAFGFRKSLKNDVVLFAAGLMAISPSLVFYSRYFIHEIFVVTMTFEFMVGIYQFHKSKKQSWLILSGLALGGMMAAKETWPIIVFSMLASYVILHYKIGLRIKIPLKKILFVIGIAFGLAFIFFSDFLQDIPNSTDFISAFSPYIDRVSSERIHNQPWYYYLNILFPFGYSGNSLHWGEGMLFIVFLLNLRIKKQPTIVSFLFWYSIILLAILSIIPYKTPWNVLGVMPGVILVASYTIYHGLEKPIIRNGVIGLLFGFMFLHSYSFNFIHESDQNNPNIYAHPTMDVITIKSKIYDIADQVDAPIFIIASNDDYWPFPWYLRHMENVGYWNHVPKNVGDASIILLSPDLESDLVKVLYEDPKPGEASLFLPLFDTKMELRHGVEIKSFIKKDIYDLVQ
ncbi:MAG: TIGR03663 family protein [Candidatus Marinimicrobia bacterium]|nr:TIGR03663 family protein [Candidatus Neomarinimicrobiota bacterium]